MSTGPAKLDVPALASLATRVLRSLDAVIQNAAVVDHAPICVINLQLISNLMMAHPDPLIRESLDAIAKVSGGPVSHVSIHGRSAIEWAIGLGRFLQNQVSGMTVEKFKKTRFSFIPGDQIGTDKFYLASFTHFAPDGKKAFEIWRAPHRHEIHALIAAIAWESSQITTSNTKPASDDIQARNKERDAEVIRLKKEKPARTAGQIAHLIAAANTTWAIMENGKPLDARAVRSILSRSKNNRQ